MTCAQDELCTCESVLQEILSGAKVVILIDFSSCGHLVLGNNSISLFVILNCKIRFCPFLCFSFVYFLFLAYSFRYVHVHILKFKGSKRIYF